MRDEDAERDHGDKEFHPRAFLRNDEQSCGCIDKDTVGDHLDTAPPGHRGGNFGSDHLQRGNDLVAERNEHEGIGKRKRQDDPRA